MSNKKKTILVFTKYYLPGFKSGGPVRSVSNLVEWCGDDYQFKIITGDRDSFENKPYQNVKLNKWNKLGNADVFYIRKKNLTPIFLLKLIRNTSYDFIYLNSFFRIQCSIIPLLLLKFVINFNSNKILLAPRGEFAPSALQIKSFKKEWYLKVVKYLGIYNDINWQATNSTEMRDIKKTIKTTDDKIFLMPNLPQKKPTHYLNGSDKKADSLKIIYLSRITPIKNIEFALKVIKEIQSIEIQFDIYGLVDDMAYWYSCKNLIESISTKHTISYKGVAEHKMVLDINSKYHLFFLPTKGENYGHAIYEALLAGTPVLISDQTPWRGLEKKKLGWDISLSHKNKFAEIIERLGKMNQRDITTMKQGVRENLLKLNIDEDAAKVKNVFNKLMI